MKAFFALWNIIIALHTVARGGKYGRIQMAFCALVAQDKSPFGRPELANSKPRFLPPLELKMAMGTRNLSIRWVLPDKKTGMEWVFYPWVYYWAKSCTRWVWRVRVRMYTTHTRLPAGKKYPHKKISHLKCLTHFSPYDPWIWPKSN